MNGNIENEVTLIKVFLNPINSLIQKNLSTGGQVMVQTATNSEFGKQFFLRQL